MQAPKVLTAAIKLPKSFLLFNERLPFNEWQALFLFQQGGEKGAVASALRV